MKLAVAVVAVALCGCAGKRTAKANRRIPPPPPFGSAAPLPGYAETGIASWYGHPYHGRKAANGETYDMHALLTL